MSYSCPRKDNGDKKQISKFPNVCAVYDITGLSDLEIVAEFKNQSK